MISAVRAIKKVRFSILSLSMMVFLIVTFSNAFSRQLLKQSAGYFLTPQDAIKFTDYIRKNTNYPALAREYRVCGRVIVSFEIDTSGMPTNVFISDSLKSDVGIREEILRVFGLVKRKYFKNDRNQKYSLSITFIFNPLPLDEDISKAIKPEGFDYLGDVLIAGYLPLRRHTGGDYWAPEGLVHAKSDYNLYEYLAENIKGIKTKSPTEVFDVLLFFTIFKDGTLGNVRFLTNSPESVKQRISSLIKEAPKWSPAMIKNAPAEDVGLLSFYFETDYATGLSFLSTDGDKWLLKNYNADYTLLEAPLILINGRKSTYNQVFDPTKFDKTLDYIKFHDPEREDLSRYGNEAKNGVLEINFNSNP